MNRDLDGLLGNSRGIFMGLNAIQNASWKFGQ